MKSSYLLLLLVFLDHHLLQAQKVFATDFEKQPKGAVYTLNAWHADGFVTANWENGMKDRSMVDDAFSASGKQSLRIAYPKGGVGPSESGAQVPIVLPDREQYFMSYRLRFSNDFSFTLGGKLPGLAAGNLCSGGEVCDGSNGFSARFMWRKGGSAVLYLYHMDKPGKWGDDNPLIFPSGEPVVFERGKWYHIMERVKINSSGNQFDGEVEVWVNGQQVLLRKGLRFTSNGEKVNRFYLSTFHGGNGPEWAPNNTCYIWIDDVTISEHKKDVEASSNP